MSSPTEKSPSGTKFLTFSHAGDLTPWASSYEWLDFYDRLFSPDPLQIQEALSIEALWQVRGLGRRSALYQVTTNLKRLIVFRPSNPSDCKASLSFAIIRFISLVTDHLTSHRDRVLASQMTMKKSCTALGIPSSVVDMRHDIAHGVEGVSPSECFAACREALVWLKTFYWDRERTIHFAICSTMSKSQDRQQVRDALDRFAESGGTRRTLKKLTSFAHNSPQAVLCEQLVDGYYLIPKREIWIAMYDDKELMRAARKSGSDEYFVPDSIIATWRPLIDQLAKRPACMRSLFERLCQTIISASATAPVATATDYTVVAAIELIRWLLTYVGDDSQRVLQWRLQKIVSQLAVSGSCHAQQLARDVARRIDVSDAVQHVDTATLPAENEWEIVEPAIKRARIEQVAGTSAVAELPSEAFGIAPKQTLEHLHCQLMLSIGERESFASSVNN